MAYTLHLTPLPHCDRPGCQRLACTAVCDPAGLEFGRYCVTHGEETLYALQGTVPPADTRRVVGVLQGVRPLTTEAIGD